MTALQVVHGSVGRRARHQGSTTHLQREGRKGPRGGELHGVLAGREPGGGHDNGLGPGEARRAPGALQHCVYSSVRWRRHQPAVNQLIRSCGRQQLLAERSTTTMQMVHDDAQQLDGGAVSQQHAVSLCVAHTCVRSSGAPKCAEAAIMHRMLYICTVLTGRRDRRWSWR